MPRASTGSADSEAPRHVERAAQTVRVAVAAAAGQTLPGSASLRPCRGESSRPAAAQTVRLAVAAAAALPACRGESTRPAAAAEAEALAEAEAPATTLLEAEALATALATRSNLTPPDRAALALGRIRGLAEWLEAPREARRATPPPHEQRTIRKDVPILGQEWGPGVAPRTQANGAKPKTDSEASGQRRTG